MEGVVSREPKRPRSMSSPATAPRRVTQALGADETHEMRALFASWGLPEAFHAGVARSWRCRLVPLAATEAEQRRHAIAGTPFLAPPELARGVFDAMARTGGSPPERGGVPADAGSSADDASPPPPPTPDAVRWACDSPWSRFARPKVAMVGGWGAPGSHLLSDRHMRMVHSFAEVVDAPEPLNLQMFHRDADDRGGVPTLPRFLRWPLPELFDPEPNPDPNRPETEPEPEPAREDTPTTAPPSAPSAPGGVGVPLDRATRLSAAGALTWWHLDDCGEFVFQVGLPVDEGESSTARRGAARPRPPGLIGPGGKPVVKLFVFAPREAYEWIAQDREMNKTTRQCALDLFDTPAHVVPSVEELNRHPFEVEALADVARKERGEEEEEEARGSRGSSGGPAGSRAGPAGGSRGGPAGSEPGTRASESKSLLSPPTFWVAPLEAGGYPLLSPPNVMHCVITTRDCVMVEERRLSLAFLDEVKYFQARARRWCEPPVQYRFIRETLRDPAECEAACAKPLLELMRVTREAMEKAEKAAAAGAFGRGDDGFVVHERTGSSLDDDSSSSSLPGTTTNTLRANAATWARAFASLATLAADAAGDHFALLESTRLAVRAALDASGAWAAAGGSRAAVAAAEALAADPRRVADATVAAAMEAEGRGGVHRLGAFLARREGDGLGDAGAPFSAVVHERGRPRWGPARATEAEALADRKEMRRAAREGVLGETLRRWRERFRE